MRYEHKCIDCACITIAEYSIKEDKEIACEVCQGKTKRIISKGTAFKLENGGWYKDGYSSHRGIKS